MIGPPEPVKIIHWWACADRRVVEVVDDTGRTFRQCMGCGADDRAEVAS